MKGKGEEKKKAGIKQRKNRGERKEPGGKKERDYKSGKLKQT
jgi:hypothetical protein